MAIASQTAASLYAEVWVKILLLVLAGLFCFAGYKLLRGFSALCGVISGIMLGVGITSLFHTSLSNLSGMIMTMAVIVLVSLVLGVLLFVYYDLGVFLTTAMVGAAVMYVPALLAARYSVMLFWIVVVFGAVSFGIAGLAFLRPAGILVTGSLGIAFGVIAAQMMGVQNVGLMAAIGVGIAVVGCVVQFVMNRGNARPFGKKWKNIVELALDDDDAFSQYDDDAYDEEDSVRYYDRKEDTSEYETIHTETLRAQRNAMQGADEIDSISSAVAAEIESKQGVEDPTIRFDVDAVMKQKASAENVSSKEYSDDSTVITLLTDMDKRPADPVDCMHEKVESDWIELLSKKQAELEEQKKKESAQDTENKAEPEAAEQIEEQPAAEPYVRERQINAEEQSAREGKPKKKGILWSILLVVFALVTAGVGLHTVEIILALCVLCVLFHRYHAAEFACAILCVRRIVDAVLLVMQDGDLFEVLLAAISAAVFLFLTAVIVHLAAQEEDTESIR